MSNTYNAIGTANPDDSFDVSGTSAPKVDANAAAVAFDNTNTGLSATNVQTALEEVDDDISQLNASLADVSRITYPAYTPTEYFNTDAEYYLYVYRRNNVVQIAGDIPAFIWKAGGGMWGTKYITGLPRPISWNGGFLVRPIEFNGNTYPNHYLRVSTDTDNTGMITGLTYPGTNIPGGTANDYVTMSIDYTYICAD